MPGVIRQSKSKRREACVVVAQAAYASANRVCALVLLFCHCFQAGFQGQVKKTRKHVHLKLAKFGNRSYGLRWLFAKADNGKECSKLGGQDEIGCRLVPGFYTTIPVFCVFSMSYFKSMFLA